MSLVLICKVAFEKPQNVHITTYLPLPLFVDFIFFICPKLTSMSRGQRLPHQTCGTHHVSSLPLSPPSPFTLTTPSHPYPPSSHPRHSPYTPSPNLPSSPPHLLTLSTSCPEHNFPRPPPFTVVRQLLPHPRNRPRHRPEIHSPLLPPPRPHPPLRALRVSRAHACAGECVVGYEDDVCAAKKRSVAGSSVLGAVRAFRSALDFSCLLTLTRLFSFVDPPTHPPIYHYGVRTCLHMDNPSRVGAIH